MQKTADFCKKGFYSNRFLNLYCRKCELLELKAFFLQAISIFQKISLKNPKTTKR